MSTELRGVDESTRPKVALSEFCGEAGEGTCLQLTQVNRDASGDLVFGHVQLTGAQALELAQRLIDFGTEQWFKEK